MQSLQKQLNFLAVELKEAEDEMTEQGMDPFASNDQVMWFSFLLLLIMHRFCFLFSFWFSFLLVL